MEEVIIVTRRSPPHFLFPFPILHFLSGILFPFTAITKGEIIHLLAGIPVFGTPAYVLLSSRSCFQKLIVQNLLHLLELLCH